APRLRSTRARASTLRTALVPSARSRRLDSVRSANGEARMAGGWGFGVRDSGFGIGDSGLGIGVIGWWGRGNRGDRGVWYSPPNKTGGGRETTARSASPSPGP